MKAPIIIKLSLDWQKAKALSEDKQKMGLMPNNAMQMIKALSRED